MSFYHWFSSHPNEVMLSGNASKLQTIGKELRIKETDQNERPRQTDFRRISSVPDIWSQHRLFDMLLRNNAEDPSYEEYEAIAVREWRAMLAILVLAESYGVTVRTTTIRFADGVTNPYLRAAYDSRPNKEAWPRMDVYYIEAGRVQYPIAMSSPTVHIVPTKDAWQSLRTVYPGQIPWVTDNQVHAPVVEDNGIVAPFQLGELETEKTTAMMPVHALLLQRWLKQYRETLSERYQQNIGQPFLLDIQLVQSYDEAMTQAFRLDTNRMPRLDSFFSSEANQQGLRIGDTPAPKNLKIFLDRMFYSVIDQNSTQAELLDTHRYAGGIAKECLVSKEQKNGKIAHFFAAMPVTDTLFKLWRENEHLKPQYSIQCVFASDGVTITQVTATVVIGDISFFKVYSVAQIESDSWSNLCTAAIWPRQKIADWKEYYFFSNELNGYRLEPEEEVASANKKTHPKCEQTDGDISVYRLSMAPERCVLKRGGSVLGYLEIRTRKEIPRGMNTNVYCVSIDFGTSATTLYGSVEGKTAKLLSGVNLWSLPLINAPDKMGNDASRLERFFFPALPLPDESGKSGAGRSTPAQLDYESLQNNEAALALYPACVPMQTILADTTSDELSRDVFLDSWIFFRSFLQARDGKDWPSMHTNLKWAHGRANDHNRIETILTEILNMLALEARCQNCSKLAITASYPLSFDDTIRDSYYDALIKMQVKIMEQTGLSAWQTQAAGEAGEARETGAKSVKQITESEAVFRFAVRQEPQNENYFVVDVGGGSTDIFISLIDTANNRTSSATSLGFGARKVLLEKLLSKEEEILRYLTNLFQNDLKGILPVDTAAYIRSFAMRNRNSMVEDMFSMRIPKKANAAAELIPNTFGDAFLKTAAENLEFGPIRELKKRIAFYIGASIWLSGMMLRGEDSAGSFISLLFTGNGSKMIRWMSTETDRIRHFLYLLFNAAGDLGLPRQNFSIRFTSMPKQEVAFGALLALPEDFLEIEKKAPKQVKFDRRVQEADDYEANSDVKYEKKNIDTNFSDFLQYMSAYKRACNVSFGWKFEPEEYDQSILDEVGIQNRIKQRIEDRGYFLSALEVVSERYMPSEAENESN